MSTHAPEERFASFEAFYPYYIHEHSNRTCRRIHVVGSGLVLVVLVTAIATMNAWWLLAMPVIGYGFAWVGHFFFENPEDGRHNFRIAYSSIDSARIPPGIDIIADTIVSEN